jgi:Tfp pilus assembly protein PilF
LRAGGQERSSSVRMAFFTSRRIQLSERTSVEQQAEKKPKEALRPDAAYLDGLASLKRSDYDQAITEFSRAIEIDRKDVFAYRKRAFAHEKKGNRGAAVDDYKRALAVADDESLKGDIKAALKRLAKNRPL